MKLFGLAWLLCGLLASGTATAADIAACGFDTEASKFSGNVSEQAKCLLRKVNPEGTGAVAQSVPKWLMARIGKPVVISEADLLAYLDAKGIAAADVGLAERSAGASRVRYFVIHDTSSPEIAEAKGFPANMDEPSYGPNNLSRITGKMTRQVNMIISRDGASRSFNAWGAVRELPATKLEMKRYAASAKPLFVHVENVQPRLKPVSKWAWIAPTPGFSAAQENRLALAYVAASVRAGVWLIPAFHFNIDEDLPDGHDDPQNFDLPRWVSKTAALVSELD